MFKIDYLQITVKDMKVAESFYDKLMPLLGFDLKNKVSATIKEHNLHIVEYPSSEYDFSICSPCVSFKENPVSIHHLAFRVNTPEEVDDFYQKIKNIDITIINEPRIFFEYGASHYALFFKDPNDIEFEIVCNQK